MDLGRESLKRTISASGGSEKGKSKKDNVVDLSCYKWYQSETPNDVSAFSLFPKRGRHKAVCQ